MDEAPKQPADAGENTAEFTPLAIAQEQLEQAADEARSTYDESRPVKQRRFRVAARTSVIRHDKERATPPAETKPTRYRRRGSWWRRTAILSFLFPLLILAVAYMIQGFWPIADTSPLTIDLYHQYASFISEFRTKLLSGESLLYSWRTGLGSNYYAIYAYYSASPLNLLLLLFPTHFITEAVTVLILLKTGLIGLTTAFMLRYAFCPEGRRTIAARKATRVRRRDEVGTDWIIVAVSAAFALSGFVLAYSWDIMWLDVIYLLPLTVLGLHRMIAQNKFVLYTVSLALAIFTNYYIALFVCIFLFFYFFVAYFSYKAQRMTPLKRPVRHFFSKALFFGGFSILAAALVAVLAIPTFLALQHTSAAGDVMPTSHSFRFTLFEFLSRHLLTMAPSIRSGLPNIYSGILAFAFIPLYVFARSIPLKEKIAHLSLLAFLFLSFNSNILDFFWNGMHYPNQLPYRYSFLYSFLLLIIVFRALTHLREYSHRMILSALGLGIIMAVLAQQLLPDEVTHLTAYASILFFLLYMAVFSLLRKRGNFRFMASLLLIVVLCELSVNTILVIHQLGSNENYTSRSRFVDDVPQVKDALEFVEMQDSSFYRLELRPQKTSNDGALYDYPGFTVFSSTARESTARMMRKLGYHSNNINSWKYTGSTLVMDSFFNLRYRVYKSDSVYNPYYREIYTDDPLHVYRLDTALSPGFVADHGVELWSTSANSPFQVQNQLVERALGRRGTFKHQAMEEITARNLRRISGNAEGGYHYSPEDDGEKSELTLEFTMPQDGMAYIFVKASRKTQVKTSAYPVGSESSASTVEYDSRSANRPETIEAGYRQEGERVRVNLTAEEGNARDLEVFAAVLDDDVFGEIARDLQSRQLVIDRFDNRGFEGRFTATEDQGRVFLSIPYDESWELWIDGEEAEILDLGNEGLLSFRADPGEHQFRLRYTPPGLHIGIYVSLGALIAFALLILIKRMIVLRRKARAHELPATAEDGQRSPATASRDLPADYDDDTRLATAEDLAALRRITEARTEEAGEQLSEQRSSGANEIEFVKLSSDEGDGYMEVRRFDALGHDADPSTFDVFEDETEAEVQRIVRQAEKRSTELKNTSEETGE